MTRIEVSKVGPARLAGVTILLALGCLTARADDKKPAPPKPQRSRPHRRIPRELRAHIRRDQRRGTPRGRPRAEATELRPQTRATRRLPSRTGLRHLTRATRRRLQRLVIQQQLRLHAVPQ